MTFEFHFHTSYTENHLIFRAVFDFTLDFILDFFLDFICTDAPRPLRISPLCVGESPQKTTRCLQLGSMRSARQLPRASTRLRNDSRPCDRMRKDAGTTPCSPLSSCSPKTSRKFSNNFQEHLLVPETQQGSQLATSETRPFFNHWRIELSK